MKHVATIHGCRRISAWNAVGLAVLLLTVSAALQAAEPEGTAGAADRERILSRIEALDRELQNLKAELTTEPPLAAEPKPAGRLDRLSIEAIIDAFYSYNFSRPEDGFNALRAYDTRDRSFSLNQAAVIIEAPTDVAAGRRRGGRIDAMVGQATQTLQGNPGQELRPDIYRPLFQAYATYVVPVGKGLTADFGKWASSLGLEGNYTQEQVNYSRSLLFNFLPFYHFGVRARYDFDERWGASYWLVNGVGQTEDFNRSPSQAAFLHWNPSRRLQTNWSYYGGNENVTRPSQPGARRDGFERGLGGNFHVAYASAVWQASDRLMLASEATDVTVRDRATAPPLTMLGAGALAEYCLDGGWSVGTRLEAVSDRGGFYSGERQMLRECTLTLSRLIAPGLLLCSEVRQDRSNRPFFFTNDADRLSARQTTALVGLTWWLGAEGER